MNDYQKELTEYNNAQKQKEMKAYSSIQESVEKWLKNNKSMLIQSLPFTLCQKDLISSGTEKAGFKLVEFDNADNVTKKDIVQNLDEKQANVILLNARAGENIEVYTNTAKALNIPLIVSVIRKVELDPELAYYQVDFGMAAEAYDNVNDMQKELDKLLPIIRNNNNGYLHIKKENENVLDRMKDIRQSIGQVSETQKHKLK